jgi:hypothetical protein
MARKSRKADALAECGNGPLSEAEAAQAAFVGDEQRQELAELLLVGQRLRYAMRPVEPPPQFVASLRSELLREAPGRKTSTRNARRSALVAAATVGSIVSVASVVGAIVFVVTRRRARLDTRPARAL